MNGVEATLIGAAGPWAMGPAGVSDILRDRMREPAGLQRMLTFSLVGHLALIAVIVIAPRNWFGRAPQQAQNVMTISLGGTGEGPRNGGMTAAAARPVQVQAPPEPKRAEPPPAVKAPEMVVATRTKAKPSKTPPPPAVKSAPEGARGRTPTRGAEVTSGNAIAYTGARGQGFGLSTGGGPGSGSMLDVADFCCPDYIVTMVTRIQSAWNQNQGARGECDIHFTILRNGSITNVTVERSSGVLTLDLAAQRAVLSTRTLPPLPAGFPNPTLGVRLNFKYQ